MTKIFTTILLVLSLSSILIAKDQDQFSALFNGNDLSDWEGSPELWKVEDGMIVGSTAGADIQNNTFLIYTGGKVVNFHLKAKLRMIGTSNSGIMYRAQPVEGIEYALSGPQMHKFFLLHF